MFLILVGESGGISKTRCNSIYLIYSFFSILAGESGGNSKTQCNSIHFIVFNSCGRIWEEFKNTVQFNLLHLFIFLNSGCRI